VAVSKEIKLQAVSDIQQHLKNVGSKDWAKLRVKYKDVPEPTFFRWVKAIKEGKLTTKKQVKSHQKQIEREMKSGKRVAKALPVAPPPSYISKTEGEENNGTDLVDFMTQYEFLYNDAVMLRDASFNADGKLRNARTFGDSVKLRTSLLDTKLKALKEIWDLQQMQKFYEVVLFEIRQENPETVKRIIKRLREANALHGMSV